MKKLIISPQAGFGNRMRALCSGILLGKFLNREVYHYWVSDFPNSNIGYINELKSINFDYIFEPIIPIWDGSHINLCLSEWLPGDGWYYSQSTAQSRLQFDRVVKLSSIEDIINCEEESILLETSLIYKIGSIIDFWDHLMIDVYKKNFTIKKKWLDIIDNIPSYKNGIWIRRGDFLSHFSEANIEYNFLIDYINNISGSKIILSDDKEYRDRVRASTSSLSDYLEMSNVDKSIVDFFILSRSDNVYGTTLSSFAKQAALFGNKPYFEIKQI